MTFEEIKASSKTWLSPSDISAVLETSAYSITLQAQEDQNKLGFPVCVIGTRTKIPRYAFIAYCESILGLRKEQ